MIVIGICLSCLSWNCSGSNRLAFQQQNKTKIILSGEQSITWLCRQDHDTVFFLIFQEHRTLQRFNQEYT